LKKYLLAVIVISILLLCVFIIYLNPGKPNSSDRIPIVNSSINNTIILTSQQKSMAIDLALNNSYFQEAMGNILGGNFDTNTSFHSEDVVVSSYRDTSPWGNNTTYILPAVKIIIGNSSMAGVNMYVFVDLNKSRVPYIGYVPRAGIIFGSTQYSSYEGGVQINISTEGQWPTSSYIDNLTIVDTGVDKYSNRAELEAHAVETALNDSTLTNDLNGYIYHVDDAPLASYSPYNSNYKGRYEVTYPVVVIEAYKNLTSTIYYYTVAVNLRNGHTIVNNLGTRTPLSSDIMNMPYPE
jgi:hypothetical protein